MQLQSILVLALSAMVTAQAPAASSAPVMASPLPDPSFSADIDSTAVSAATPVIASTPNTGNTQEEERANQAIQCQALCVDPATATECHQKCQTDIVANINAKNGTTNQTSNSTTTNPTSTNTPSTTSAPPSSATLGSGAGRSVAGASAFGLSALAAGILLL